MSKALIFDFDGVIVLSEQARFNVLQQSAQKYGIQIDNDLFNEMVGRTTTYFFANSLPHAEEPILDKIRANYTKEYKDRIVDHVVPVVMTTDFIRDYDGPKLLAVASGNTKAALDTVLSHLGIHGKFTCIVGQEYVNHHKPDPEVYNLTAQQLGCSNEDCTVVEDTVLGAQAAIAAGMSVYIFLNGANNRSEFDDMSVAGFLETAEQLRQALA